MLFYILYAVTGSAFMGIAAGIATSNPGVGLLTGIGIEFIMLAFAFMPKKN